jgi:hypothetical protein
VGDIDSITIANGFYAMNNATVGTKPEGLTSVSTLIVQRFSATAISQILFDTSTGNMWTRSYIGAAWLPWRLSFHRGNILGTVSQTAGVPTGAIIQRGSNANGEFTRYADGSVIATTVARNAQTTVVSGSIFSSALLGPFTQPVTGIIANNSFASGSSENVWFGVLTHPDAALYVRAFAASNNVSSTYRITTTGYWFNI